MRLKSLTYKENDSKTNLNPWELEGLALSESILIVGKNATGKSRIVKVIHNLARLIQSQQVGFNGEWSAIFLNEMKQELKYTVQCEEGNVGSETISVDGANKLERNKRSSKVYSEINSRWQEISPPQDRLVLHVRRDQNEFPFLENLVSWASGVRGFAFANSSPLLIEIPGNPFNLTSLNAVPSALEKLSESQLKKVLKQLERMGYLIENASAAFIEGFPPNIKGIFLKEKGISHPIKQSEISQGMFRAFALLVIIEFLLSEGGIKSILVDDMGEGLDFERSKKLAEIIFENVRESKIQFVATSNDSFLMNAIPLENLTICYRSNHKVRCLNYATSKEKFDEWQQLGLNNFDLFSSNFLLGE